MGTSKIPTWPLYGLWGGYGAGFLLDSFAPEFEHKLLWTLACLPVGVVIAFVIDRWLTRRKRA